MLPYLYVSERRNYSGASAAQRAAKRSPILIQERKGNPWVDFLMVIMASGIARGRVRTTTTTESRNMAAILQIIHPCHVAAIWIWSMYFRHEIEAMRVKSVSLQLIMPNIDHCSVPLCSNNRSKGQLGITFHRFPVDQYTKKSWIVRIRRDVGKNFQVSDCVLRL